MANSRDTRLPEHGVQFPTGLDAMKCGDSGSGNAGSNCIDKGHPDAHGSDAGGNLTKQGAPAMAVESRQSVPLAIQRLMDEVRAKDPGPFQGFDRAHNRHNRS